MPAWPEATLRDRIQTVWNELADFDLADSDAALVHVLRAFGGLVRAPAATWCALVCLDRGTGEPFGGWRVRARRALTRPRPGQQHHHPPGEPDATLVGECLRASAWRADPVCVTRMDARTIGVTFRVTADTAAGFVWQGPARARFTAADREVLAYAVRGLKWFHRQALVSHGLLAARVPFTARERAVLSSLLRQLPESAIADRLGVSPAAVQEYVSTIAQKVGVTGRVDLLTLWGRGGGPPD